MIYGINTDGTIVKFILGENAWVFSSVVSCTLAIDISEDIVKK